MCGAMPKKGSHLHARKEGGWEDRAASKAEWKKNYDRQAAANRSAGIANSDAGIEKVNTVFARPPAAAAAAPSSLLPHLTRPPAVAQRNAEKQKAKLREEKRKIAQAKADLVKGSVARKKKLQKLRDDAAILEDTDFEAALEMLITAQAGYAEMNVEQVKLDVKIAEMQQYIETEATC